MMEFLQCCDVCGQEHNTELCPELGLDQAHIQVDQLSTRARLTLPPFLEIVDNGQGLVGVVAKETIDNKKQLGPYEAKRTTHIFEDNGFFTLKLIAKDGTTVCLDTTDENECNWLCLVRAATTSTGQNCMAYQVGSNLFYNTTREIAAGEELQVWYATHYAKKLGKPVAPNGFAKVLLGHSIEPLPQQLSPPTEVTDENHTDDLSNSNHDNSYQGDDAPLLEGSTSEVSLTTGEIRKAHWCPRCGHTFSTRTAMVQHLRQHVLNAAAPKDVDGTPVRRGRGRPRIHPPKVANTSVSPVIRGRPRKRKQLETSSDNDVTGDEDDDYDDEDHDIYTEMPSLKRIAVDVTGIDDADSNYSTKKGISNTASKVLPQRRSRGTNSKYFDDYVVSTIGKRKTENEEKFIKSDVEKVIKSNVETRVGMNPKITVIKIIDVPPLTKRGRRRPKKAVETEKPENNKPAQLQSEGSQDSERRGVMKQSQTIVESPKSEDNVLELDKTGECGDDEKYVREQANVTGSDVTEGALQLTKDEVEGNGPRIESNSGNADELPIDVKLEIDILDSGSSNETRHINVDTFHEMDDNDNKETSSSEPLKSVELHTEIMANSHVEMSAYETGLMDYTKAAMDIPANDSPVVSLSRESQVDLNDSGDIADESPGNISSNGTKAKSKRTKIDIENHMYIVTNEDGTQSYACKTCDKRYAARSYLRLHIPKHSGQYNCAICSKIYTRKESLRKHICQGSKLFMAKPLEEIVEIITINGKEFYKCLECGSMCDEEIDALSHYSNHGYMESKIACSECDGLFSDEQSLVDHDCPKRATDTHKCDICHQGFKSAQYLYRHMVMHTDLFKCEKCQKTFARKDSLQKHILRCCPKLAESYKIFSCEVCCQAFSTKSGKLNHNIRCNAAKCSTCKRVFGTQQDLDLHTCNELDVADKNSVEFSCGECGKSFSSQYYLIRHKELHKNKFNCSICFKTFPSREDVKEHEVVCKIVKKIKSEPGRHVKCYKCEEEFSSAKQFREHYFSHTHPHQCQTCLKRFIKVGSLNEHKCAVSGEHLLNCAVCDRQFSSERFLTKHLESHGPTRYTCDKCNKQFTDKKYYHKHVCQLEDGTHAEILQNKLGRKVIEQLVCEVCGKDFVNRSNLTKHLLLHGEKKYKCPHCGKRFHHYTYVNEHVNTVHYNLYKYQCNTCGKMLKSKTGLVVHTKQFHSTNCETFPCEKCGKVFKQKGNLRTHMYSHVTERKFVCEFCNKTWKYPDQLSRHKLTHTMVNKLSCIHCDKKFCKRYELKKHIQVFHSGCVYVCGVCFSRCGHRHTLIRHYKRKHPESYHLLSVSGYTDSLLKKFDDVGEYARSSKKAISQSTSTAKSVGAVCKNDGGTITLDMNAQTVETSENAVQALQSLSNETVTLQQLATLRDSGLLKGENLQNLISAGLINSDQVLSIPENSTIREQETSYQQPNITTDPNKGTDGEIINISNVTDFNMVTNSDGSISINGVHHIPRSVEAIESAEGQMLILQIVDLDRPEYGQTENLNGAAHHGGGKGEIIATRDVPHVDITQEQSLQQNDVPREAQETEGVTETADINQQENIQLAVNKDGRRSINPAEFDHIDLLQKRELPESQKGPVIQQEAIDQDQIVSRSGNQGQVIQEDGNYGQIIQQGQVKQQGHIIPNGNGQEGQIIQQLAVQQGQIITQESLNQGQFVQPGEFDLQGQILQQDLGSRGQVIQQVGISGGTVYESVINMDMQKLGPGELIHVQEGSGKPIRIHRLNVSDAIV